jgi:guanosine-3',5'-bis(diphosphate) 3'-pyrophosphohydrolase
MNLAEFVIRVESANANINIPLIRKAYEFSDLHHKGQLRASGEPFVSHCLEVAFILADLHADSTTVAAGVLHDILEDTDTTEEDLKNEFGPEIADLVDGVTKIGEYQYRSHAEAQAESFRKMMIAMARDIRVILIKLADRLHNMRTLEYLPEAKQRLIAAETREVYAPLAHRFGMARIKWELEDLSFRFLYPEEFETLAGQITERRSEREEYIAEVVGPLKEYLDVEGIPAEISGRPKHLDSIWRKMRKRNMPLEEIYDLLAIRVMVESKRDCYHVLGIVTELWTPVMDRFHDYIATPKSNGYQSLHTTVIGPRSRSVEIQIRTHTMHRLAEYGIAAHWLYKEGKQQMNEADRQLSWLRQVLEWQQEMDSPTEFMEYLKVDLFRDEVFVFTPRGELKQLQSGATALDFAYAVHTNVGHKTTGAKVNGRMATLATELNTGDEVEIITSVNQTPHQDWLHIAKSSRARSKIRHWFRQKGAAEATVLGRDLLEREVRKLGFDMPTEHDLDGVAADLARGSVDALLSGLGYGTISLKQVLPRLYPHAPPPRKVSRLTAPAHQKSQGIRIQGMGHMMFRFAQCCHPVPGDPIVGFITRGRGITIHHRDCHTVAVDRDNQERSVEVEWDVQGDEHFVVKLLLFIEERRDLLRDITAAVADAGANVRGADLEHRGTGTAAIVIEVQDTAHLDRVTTRLKGVKGVSAIERARGTE